MSQACYHTDIVITIMLIAASLQTGLLVLFAWRLERSLRRFRARRGYSPPPQPPSVSICIPARNEMHAMTECLEVVLKSDYEKMEVIVYDDSSVDDTSILIRSFAHAGVRFVPGTALPEGWLGKNHALEILAQEASGTYLIFLDVDTRIAPHTISWLVSYISQKHLTMLSVIPRRQDAWRTSALLGTLRYFWQLLLARKSAPATSSSLWMINRQALLKTLGGFSAYKNNVQPEAALAAQLGVNAYHTLISDNQNAVAYEKKWRSQTETSRRLLYPMAGSTWWGATLAIILLLFLNLPLIGMISTLFVGWWWPQIMSVWFLCAYVALFSVFTSATRRHGWWLGGLLWPIVILQELGLCISSVWGYSRHTITWKGRLVTMGQGKSNTIAIDE